MDHEIRSTFTVRSYEVDSYAHLNNGVYLSWYEQGRLDYLKSLGFSYDGFAEREEWFVVGRTEVVFRKALHEGENVELISRIEELGRSSVRFLQEMRREGEPEFASQSRTIMVFSNAGGSIPIPDDFRSIVEAR
jgi:acyl-CoA thioester hydrolase